MAKKARIRWDVNNEELEKSKKELKEIQKQAGLTDKEVKEIGDSFEENTKQVEKTKSSFEGFGKMVAGLGLAAVITGAVVEFAKLGIEIQKSRKEVALLTDLTGRALDKATAQIKALSSVWDKEFNEVLRAANTLSKEFDISVSDALESINEGFKRGIDINGEYLDSIREYSLFAKEAGLTTKQFNIVLQEQTKQGIFSDKGIDAIKEAVLSLREMTPVARDAMRAIGMNADQVIMDLNSGARTYFDVIQEISKRTRETTDQVAKGMVFADIFKGAGEDAGDFVLELDKLNTEYAELNREQQQYYDLQTQLVENQEDFNEVLIDTTKQMGTAWNDIKRSVMPILTSFLELFTSHGFQINKLTDEYYEKLSGTASPKLRERLAEVTVEMEKQKKVVEEINKEHHLDYRVAIERSKAAGKALDELTGEYEALKMLVGESDDRIKAWSDSMAGDDDSVVESTHEAAKAIENLSLSFDDLDKSLDNLVRKFAGGDVDEGAINRILFGDPETSEELFLENEKRITDANERMNDEIKQGWEDRKTFDEEERNRKMAIADESFNAAANLTNTLTNLKLANLQREFLAAEGNEKKQRQIMREMAKVEKQQAIFNAVINTAVGITRAIPIIPLMALAAATGALQIAAISAQPLPKFKKGGLVGGKPHEQGGTVIEAELGEFVNRKESAKAYPELLKRANNLQLDKGVVDKLMSGGSQDVTVINSNKELIEAINTKPDWQVMINEKGFMTRVRSNFGTFTQQRNRFSQ